MIAHPNRNRKTATATAVFPAEPTPPSTRTRKPPEPDWAATHERDYAVFMHSVADSLAAATAKGRRVFQTAAPSLYHTCYLAKLPALKQKHTCMACGEFISRFGKLVTVNADGTLRSVMWDENRVPAFYIPAVKAMREAVEGSRVSHLFLSADQTWGMPHSLDGNWKHLAVSAPQAALTWSNATRTADQAMADTRENFKNVATALGDPQFSAGNIISALHLLRRGKLDRSEPFITPLEWLDGLRKERAAAFNMRLCNNKLWAAVASAPNGFCHVRGGMIGMLIKMIADHVSPIGIQKSWNEAMRGDNFQRPKAAPAAQTVDQAEKLFATMGLERSLERRFATLNEVQAFWLPQTKSPGTRSGLFADVTTRGSVVNHGLRMDFTNSAMTWRKFSEQILPTVQSMNVLVPSGRHAFAALVTAVHSDAEPLLRWDRPDRRNPVSIYTYVDGSPATQWGLTPGRWVRVNVLTSMPDNWFDRRASDTGCLMVLDGAMDTNSGSGLGLFPEIMREELHGVRAVIEAFSRKGVIQGRKHGSACGLAISSGCNLKLQVTFQNGFSEEITIDRWD